MTVIIRYDGLDDYSLLDSEVVKSAADEYAIVIRFKASATPEGDVLTLLLKDSANYFYYRVSSERLVWAFGGSNTQLTGIPASSVNTEFVDVELSKVAGGGQTITFVPTGASTTFGSSRPFSFSKFCDGFDKFGGDIEFIKHYSDLAKTTLLNHWSPNDSAHTAGNPVVVDLIGGNNATGVNMPTAAIGQAGSAWFDLGGGSPIVAIDPIDQAQAIEQVTLTQQSSITIGGLTQIQSIEQLALQTNGTLSLNNLDQIQSIEQVNLTQAHIISVNSVEQSQELDQVSLLVAGTLSVDNTNQAQTLKQTVLSVIASLAINDITQAQEVEQVIVTAFNGSAVSIASIDQAQNIGSVTLSQLNVVSVDNLSQSQLLQAVNFNGVVVGYLQGVLTVISAYNGSIKLTNPLTGEIRIL